MLRFVAMLLVESFRTLSELSNLRSHVPQPMDTLRSFLRTVTGLEPQQMKPKLSLSETK